MIVNAYRTIAAMVLLALAAPAPAQVVVSDLTGATLVSKCSVGAQSDPSFCLGYIIAIADVRSIQRGICRQARTTNPQLVAVVMAYMRRNHAKTNMAASFLVEAALSQAFPCGAPVR